MNEYLMYILKVSLCLTAFYFFYLLFLRKETYFLANRIYLMGSLIISFIIPFLHTGKKLNLPSSTQLTLQEIVPDNFDFENFTHQFSDKSVISMETLLGLVYLIGVSFLAIRFLLIIFNLWKLTTQHKTSALDKIRLVFLENGTMPFSFFRYIFVDPSKFQGLHLSKPIIEHEKVHARELHSLDNLIVEIAVIALWFNPISFLFRKSIKENHEYLADSGVLRSGMNPVDYIIALSNEVFRNHAVPLTSSFRGSTIKKRLRMITRISTTKKRWIKFIFILPLFWGLLTAFGKPVVYANPELAFFPSPIKPPDFLNFNHLIQPDSSILNNPAGLPVEEKSISQISGWGLRKHPLYKIKKFHSGVDFKAPEGSPVYATASGNIEVTVIQAINEGNYIVIKHNSHFQTVYAHLQDILVSRGNFVEKGQIIGHVGNSGLSTGPHLHYEVKKDGKNVNPQPFLPTIK